MAETLTTDSSLSLARKYELLIKQLNHLLNKEDNVISSLANLSAALKQTFAKISWVGFYFFDGSRLRLGPFQGKLACTNIEMGKGVCGTAAAEMKTIIVPDVNKFSGHIACDVDSKSEIVIPVLKDNELFGVLDVDSSEYNAFDETDAQYLEEICSFLSKKIL